MPSVTLHNLGQIFCFCLVCLVASDTHMVLYGAIESETQVSFTHYYYKQVAKIHVRNQLGQND